METSFLTAQPIMPERVVLIWKHEIMHVIDTTTETHSDLNAMQIHRSLSRTARLKYLL